MNSTILQVLNLIGKKVSTCCCGSLNMVRHIVYASLAAFLLNPFAAFAQFDALFVSQYVPTEMVAGKTYSVSVTMKNMGGATWKWGEPYRLGSQSPQDNLIWGLNRSDILWETDHQDNVDFRFQVKAPDVPGRYNFQWQMLLEGVRWFGAKTPLVSVNVVDGRWTPVIELYHPSLSQQITSPEDFFISVDVEDRDDSVVEVQFYIDNQLVGKVVPDDPYQRDYRLDIPYIAVGSHNYHVAAVDQSGLRGVSQTRPFSVSSAGTSLTRNFVYDNFERLCKVIEPEVGATVIDYDWADNVLWSVSGLTSYEIPYESCGRDFAYDSGRRVDRTYDLMNRIKSLHYPDGDGDQEWSYYPDGLAKAVVTKNSSQSVRNAYTYNSRRLLTSEIASLEGGRDLNLGYGYDLNGNLSSQVYPSGLVISFAPNAMGQPTVIKDNFGSTYASGITYHPSGEPRAYTRGNGIAHLSQLNVRGGLQSISDNNVVAYRYAYDSAGNVASIFDDARGSSYDRVMEYDGLNRLVASNSSSFGGDFWKRYQYDALDNITASKGGGGDLQYWYAGNRLSSITNAAGGMTTSLIYDEQGNVKQRNGTKFAFDFGNRLKQIVGSQRYHYDASGRRLVSSSALGDQDITLYGADGLLAYQDDASSGVREHIYLGGRLLVSRDFSGEAVYQHVDALGSVVALTDEAGQTVNRKTYEPYGVSLEGEVDGIGYAGHLADQSTGLIYMQGRYYDPQFGIFMSVDPDSVDRATATNFCRYCYAKLNPYTYKDPDGRQVVLPGPVPIPLPLPISPARDPAGGDNPFENSGITSLSSINVRAESSTREKTYITYTLTLTDPVLGDKVYVGRASGYGTPEQVLLKRYLTHLFRRSLGYANPKLDQARYGFKHYSAIRGREQQLIDYHGGVESDGVGNLIRGVAKGNVSGEIYHNAANLEFGQLYPYTGWSYGR